MIANQWRRGRERKGKSKDKEGKGNTKGVVEGRVKGGQREGKVM